MDKKDIFKFLELSARGRTVLKRETGLCGVCKKEYKMVLLSDGGVLTFHGDEHGMFEHDDCFDELQKMTKELREGMRSQR